MLKMYDFECSACGEVFERLIQVDSSIQPPPEPDANCAACGSAETRHIVSPSHFQLAGSCWEKDGYSKGGAQ